MRALFGVIVLVFLFLPASVFGQTTEFTYQGRLLLSGLPANGSYDFEFRLFDDVAAGAQQGQALTLTTVNVNNGVFSVRLDFGDQFPGAARFLEIRVRQAGDQLFSVLVPRQSITSAPYAIKSLNADNAVTATNATQLDGLTANQFVSTTDTRLTDSRNPSPGSANYIQNGTVQQPANFNISGTGSIGTRLIATFINSTSIGINNDTPAASFHIKVNAGNVLAGNAGCSGGFAGIGFGPSFTACTNYSLLGNGVDTMVNRPTGGNIFFREANANQMMIAPGGNVGIGTSTPQQRLHVDGNEVLSTGFQSGFKFRDRGSISAGDDWVWYSAANVARFFRAGVGDLLTIQTNGVIGLTALGSAGSTALCRNAANQIATCSSSIRYKSNITVFRSGLDLVKQLHPVTFRWKDSGILDLGLVAEDVNKVEPLLTTTNAGGEVEGVKYDRLGVVLLNSINEQQAQIHSQQEQIKQQQQTILRQQLELEQQKNDLDSVKTLVCSQKRRATFCRRNSIRKGLPQN